MTTLARSLRRHIAQVVLDTRQALGWSQRDLARHAHVSQSTICRVELGRIDSLSIETAARVLDALGVRASLELRAPFVAKNSRQRDAGHARCLAYVVRRLERAGWLVRTEVEIVSGSTRGWIDILAFRPSDRTLLVVEIKTELVDLGAIMRQQNWYEREAWAAARRFGWRPTTRIGALMGLGTDATIQRIRDNRQLIAHAFAGTAAQLGDFVNSPAAVTPDRAIALVDPLDRGRAWLRRAPVSGRSVRTRYSNYADFISRTQARRAA
jgi:transcriptional regulator with XRE-family HTH domain